MFARNIPFQMYSLPYTWMADGSIEEFTENGFDYKIWVYGVAEDDIKKSSSSSNKSNFNIILNDNVNFNSNGASLVYSKSISYFSDFKTGINMKVSDLTEYKKNQPLLRLILTSDFILLKNSNQTNRKKIPLNFQIRHPQFNSTEISGVNSTIQFTLPPCDNIKIHMDNFI